jgi:hypothetical protein
MCEIPPAANQPECTLASRNSEWHRNHTGAWTFHSAPLVPLSLKMGTRFSLVLLNADGRRNIVAVTPLADGSRPIL